MTFTPDFLLQLMVSFASAVAVGVGVYSGIKKDLAVTHEKALSATLSATRAHERIDNILSKD